MTRADPTRDRSPQRARRWPACVLVSALLHGAVLASLSVIPIARGSSDVQAAPEDEGPDYVIQLRVRPSALLATAEAEPLANPEPAARDEIELAAAPAPAAEPAAPRALASELPEIEPEPSPEPPLVLEPPPVPPAPVVTTTAEEAPSVAQAAPVAPPQPQPESAPPAEPTSEPAPVPAPVASTPTPTPNAAAPANPAPAPGAGASSAAASTAPNANAPSTSAPGAPATGGGSAPGSGTPNLGALDDGFHLRALRSDRPEYPEEARRRNEEGSVTCRLTIDREGRVVEVVVILSSGSEALDRAAVRALKRWRFESLAKITDRERVHAVQKLSFELHARRG